GLAGHSDCCIWIGGQFQQWTRTAFATVQAGHGDLRSALGAYLAGWPFLFHFHATSLLQRLEFAPQFMDQLQVKRNSFTIALSRNASRQPWDWLHSHIHLLRVRSLNNAKGSSTGAISSPLPTVVTKGQSVDRGVRNVPAQSPQENGEQGAATPESRAPLAPASSSQADRVGQQNESILLDSNN